jgi:hypothetical protein
VVLPAGEFQSKAADASRDAINIRFIGVSITEDRCPSANLTGALTAWFDGAPHACPGLKTAHAKLQLIKALADRG